MKLCTIQPHMPDSITDSVREITRWIEMAAKSGADVVVFPEMMLTGYDHQLHDLFKDTRWHLQVDEALTELCSVVDASGTTGTIISVEDVANSNKLMKLVVDFGDHTRSILAGIKNERANPREIEGRQALFVLNLAEKKMAGEISQGMLFDIGYADHITPCLVIPELPVPNGTRAG